jgi:phosphoribosyl 1,2-cyclic phosphate phosphodiesterase
VVECTKREEGGYPGHLSIPEVARMRRKLEECGSLKTDGPMIATHFGHQMEMLHEELDSVLSGQNILAGYDGISVDF